MTGLAYLGGLLLSIGAMALIDARWRLAFWRSPGASAAAVGAGTVLLLLWDLAGIGFGVFFRGDSPWATGLVLAPELPVEEPVFLVFLCYLSLVAVLGIERMLRRDAGPDGEPGTASSTDAASKPGGGHP
ncbi:lycopene cyclase domain-containing protein [Agromyces ramosus]|jgi:lycopene cyclase domain-containing protein|uniref:Lycopene cyclase domain-containing protein n=1 Tax=Agromyces ramosus TaxID=33879 RepID=A0A4Q7MJ65_9MICO|nr:lycopene cyclase domain-containing protein [Agromyces ramosus]RZS66579.1 lycopene cyclase domain-containing protein [Agromyces ramosus]